VRILENKTIRVVIATKNEGKIKEILEIIKLNDVSFSTFEDFDNWPDVDENGSTFKENAVLKAKATLGFSGLPALADDSGLEVDALGGEPGVISARYAGDNCSTPENNTKLLNKLKGVAVSERTAQFRCVAAYFNLEGTLLVTEGICRGHIAVEPKGTGGFGYDPLFVPDGYDVTIAQLPPEEKNQISHRGKAFSAMKSKLEKLLSSKLS